jgi:predicted NUDIX family NTP pyrophosphohydrolase
MALQKRWEAVAPAAFTLGARKGEITLTSPPQTNPYRVKMVAILSKDGVEKQYVINRVKGPVLTLGEVGKGIKDRADLSEYSSGTLTVAVAEQDKPLVDPDELEQYAYDQDPINAKRSHLVDSQGNSTGETDNPLKVQLTGASEVTIENAQIDVDMTDEGPDYSAVRIGNGTNRADVTAANALKTDSSHVTQPVSGPLTDAQLRATSVPVSGPLTDAQLRASPVPVNGTVSVGNFPSGGATEAKQDTGNASLASIDGKLNSLGQKNMAGSAPVVIASDQSALPVSLTNNNVIVHGNGNFVGQTLSGIGNFLSTDFSDYKELRFQVLGTFVGSVVVEGSSNNTNWEPVPYVNIGSPNTPPSVAAITAPGLFYLPLTARWVRIRCSAYTSGSITVNSVANTHTNSTDLLARFVTVSSSALPTGAATAASQTDGSQKTQIVDSATGVQVLDAAPGSDTGQRALAVRVISQLGAGGGGGGGGTSQADKSTFTEGTTAMTPVGGVFNETISADPTEDQAAAVRITAKRAMHSNLRNASGTEVGTAGAPLRTDPTGTTPQPVTGPLTDAQLRASPVAVDGPLTDAELRAAPVPVSGPLTDAELRAAAVPVSAASLPLPTGAATEAKQDAGNASVASLDGKLNSLGQKNMAGSVPVTLASDQSAVPISAASLPLPTGAATDAALSALRSTTTVTGTLTTAFGQELQLDCTTGISAAMVEISGTWTGSVGFESSVDGTTWQSVYTADMILLDGQLPSSATANGRFLIPVVGYQKVRAVGVLASGTANVTITGTRGHDGVLIALQAFTYVKQTGSDAFNSKIVDGSDISRVATVSVDGAVKVDGSAVTQPVSAASLPLPTGAATEAKQDTGNAALSAIQTATQLIDDGVGTPGSAAPGKGMAALGTDGTNARMLKTDAAGELQVDVVSSALPTGAASETTLSAINTKTATLVSGRVPVDGSAVTQPVQETGVSSATLSNVAGNASSVQLLASNSARRMVTIHNDSTAILYVKFGTTASATSYTVKIPPDGFYEFPTPMYTGRVDGIWSAANGAARITEY